MCATVFGQCLEYLVYNFGQGLNGSKVSFERSQNMLYSLKANKNHIEEDHISLARPYHNGLNFFLNNLEENNFDKALRCTFFWEWKNSWSSKFVQLELLDKAKARS